MPNVKIGLRVGRLGLPVREALRTAAAIGAEGVQIDAQGELSPQNLSRTAQRSLRHYLQHLGLELAALGFPTRAGYDTEDGLEQRLTATQAVMSVASQLGTRVVTNRLGRLPEDDSSPTWAMVSDAMRELAAHGDRVGAVFAIEIGSNAPQHLRHLLDSFDTAGLGASYDPGSVWASGHDPLAGVSALGDAIVHSHARDAHTDPATGDRAEVAAGHGDVDWPAYLAALEEIGYRGFLTVDRSGRALSVDEAGAAIAFLKAQRSG